MKNSVRVCFMYASLLMGLFLQRWLKHYQETVGAAKNTQEYTGASIVADDITENKENANHEAKCKTCHRHSFKVTS